MGPERGLTLVCLRDGDTLNVGWLVLTGGQSYDPSSQQAGPRDFDPRWLTAWSHLSAPGLPLARFPLHQAPGGPFQQHRGAEPLPSQSFQTSAQRAALWSCPTLGISYRRQRRYSVAAWNEALTVAPGKTSLAWLSEDRIHLRGKALTDQ